MLGGKKEKERISKPKFKTFIFGMYVGALQRYAVVLKQNFSNHLCNVYCNMWLDCAFWLFLRAQVKGRCKALSASPYSPSNVLTHDEQPTKALWVQFCTQYSVHVPNSVHIQREETTLCSGNSYNVPPKLHVPYIKCLLLFFLLFNLIG